MSAFAISAFSQLAFCQRSAVSRVVAVTGSSGTSALGTAVQVGEGEVLVTGVSLSLIHI